MRQDDEQAYIAELEEYRRWRDEAFRAHPDSPVPQDLRGAAFGGLAYFPIAHTYCVEATLTPHPVPEVVPLGSTQGDVREQLRFGELTFQLGGAKCRLAAFKDAGDPDGAVLFVPFRDTTSGHETYAAGRYVEPRDSGKGTQPRAVVVDFNLAYNPYCAYDARFSCTLPPAENSLPVPVTAGERTYDSGH